MERVLPEWFLSLSLCAGVRGEQSKMQFEKKTMERTVTMAAGDFAECGGGAAPAAQVCCAHADSASLRRRGTRPGLVLSMRLRPDVMVARNERLLWRMRPYSWGGGGTYWAFELPRSGD